MKRPQRNFEIEFYEKLAKKIPDFAPVLFCLGDAYTQRGFYKEGLAVDRRLVQIRPEDPIVYYNLACSLSLVDDTEGALEALKKAISLGYDDFEYIFQDPDLENLRKNPSFLDFSRACQELNCDNDSNLIP